MALMDNIDLKPDAKKYTYAVYILQALFFVTVFTPVLGIIVNYIKDDDVRETWLESHFTWQKRTFWYGLLWIVLANFVPLFGYPALAIVAVWLIYRIAKGWIYLVDGKVLYPAA